MTDDQKAREARAKRLRDQIEQEIPAKADEKQPQSPARDVAPVQSPTGAENPREFIQRRMRELSDDAED